MRISSLVVIGFAGFGSSALAAETFTVQSTRLTDEKAVFATVESRDVVPARARIAGTIVTLTVREGDEVGEGQVIGVVADEKLALRIQALDAEINGLKSQLAQAEVDLGRAQALAKGGAVSRQQLDQAATAAQVAASSLKAREAERALAAQQLDEGAVKAPTAGRVLAVPLTVGSVVMPGDVLASVAAKNYVLRLRVPERATGFLKAGETVRIDGRDLGAEGAKFGTVTLVYPRIEGGNVIADADLKGLGDYFVGQRIEVWIPAGERHSLVIPSHLIETRFGIDYVHRRAPGGDIEAIPIQRGRDFPSPDMPDGIEILSGVAAGDVLVSR